ncbi:hypothetical protein EJ110_NYTH26963 [Nymphaea thermarum]|nr:hypothetical protein EJ110_NYTH26963 [Nymphaea thermarum]
MKGFLPLLVLGLLVAFSFHGELPSALISFASITCLFQVGSQENGREQWAAGSRKLPLDTCVDFLPVTGQDCTEGDCQNSCRQAHSGVGDCLNATTCFCTYPCK